VAIKANFCLRWRRFPRFAILSHIRCYHRYDDRHTLHPRVPHLPVSGLSVSENFLLRLQRTNFPCPTPVSAADPISEGAVSSSLHVLHFPQHFSSNLPPSLSTAPFNPSYRYSFPSPLRLVLGFPPGSPPHSVLHTASSFSGNLPLSLLGGFTVAVVPTVKTFEVGRAEPLD